MIHAKTYEISLVIPAHNEEKNLSLLIDRIDQNLKDVNWEAIIVDDGSQDGTWDKLFELHQKNANVKGLRFSRNFGHQNAIFAGLTYASGKAVIMLDGDLQHPPELLPQLIHEWRQGYKIVQTVRLKSSHNSFFKELTSRLFYRIFYLLSHVDLKEGMADFRLLDSQVVKDILKFKEESPFLRGLVQWVGYPNTTIEYKPEKRLQGESSYSALKMIGFAWKGISSFSIYPLRLGAALGLIMSFISLMAVLYAIIGELYIGNTIPGWASTLAILSFLFSILFLLIGLQGEYLGRVFNEVIDRPRFIVSETHGLETSREER